MSKKKEVNTKKSKLTDKQERFCQEYMIDLNATQAAIRAGYSKKTAQAISTENLSKPLIQARIQELKSKISDKAEITAVEILKELKNFAYSDITETITLTVEELKELPSEVRRLITQYKKTTKTLMGHGNDPEAIIEEAVELKFVDKMRAFEMLNKHIGFYEKDNKQKEINLGDISSIKIVRPSDGNTGS